MPGELLNCLGDNRQKYSLGCPIGPSLERICSDITLHELNMDHSDLALGMMS